jgi:hypothetical protein
MRDTSAENLDQWFSTFVRPRLGKFFFLEDEGPV